MKYRRTTRPRNFRPLTEALEPRIALSAAIGVGLETNSPYNADPIWTDLANLSLPWAPATGSSLALTATGYPLANASVNIAAAGYPAGNYQFSYTGAATVSFSGDAQLVGTPTVSGGVTSGTVFIDTLQGGGGWLTMQVTGVNSANPMGNFHLMMPGYGNGTTSEPMFTPAFLQSLQPFPVLRYMDWENINGSTEVNWSDRVTPSDYPNNANGMPFEDMINLSNVTQKSMWLNIPAEATPQFVQSLAQSLSTPISTRTSTCTSSTLTKSGTTHSPRARKCSPPPKAIRS